MKHLLLLAISILILSCKSTAPSTAVIDKIPDQIAVDLPVKEVTEKLKVEYDKAMSRLEIEKGIKDIEISSVELTFTVTNQLDKKADISVLIFAGSGSKALTTSYAYGFTMKKPEASNAPKSIGRSASHLSDAIIGAAAKFENDLKEFADLKKESFTLDITYSIKLEGDGTFTFDIWKVGAGVGVTKSNEVIHEMVLEFKQKEKEPIKNDDPLKLITTMQKDIATIKSDVETIKKQTSPKK